MGCSSASNHRFKLCLMCKPQSTTASQRLTKIAKFSPLFDFGTPAAAAIKLPANLFMSLIHTCELGGANPFHYLTELQLQAPEVEATPSQWMSWNYRETLERSAGP